MSLDVEDGAEVPRNGSVAEAEADWSRCVLPELEAAWREQVEPLLNQLDRHMDARLVRTLDQSLRAILQLRHRNLGLLLSQLGAYITTPAQAPAGTKRLSNLLRSSHWQAQEIADYLWQQALFQQRQWSAADQDVFLLWDESVLEKPESLQAQGLCPVRSSKAARLSRIKPG
jgi:hypothetical protein